MPLKPESQQTFNQFLESQRTKLSPQEFQQLQAIYGNNEALQQEVANSVMMKADYSRLSQQRDNEFNQKLAELNAKAAQLEKYDQDIAAWEEYVKNNTVSAAQYQAAQAELTQLRNYRSTVETQIKNLGLDELIEGLDDDNQFQQQQLPNGGDMNINQNNNANQNNFDPSRLNGERYLTRQVAENKIQEAAITSVAAQAILMDKDDEYRRLTGQGLPNRQAILVEALQAGKSLDQFIDEKFNLAQLRADSAKAAQEAEIERRVNEQVAKRVSEQRLPIPGSQGAGSPVISQTMQAMNATSAEEARNVPLFSKPGAPGRGAQRATEAFLTGKYKNELFSPHRG